MEYISRVACHSNEATTTMRDGPRGDEENRELTELALRGLQLLSTWSQQVMELVSGSLAPVMSLHICLLSCWQSQCVCRCH